MTLFATIATIIFAAAYGLASGRAWSLFVLWALDAAGEPRLWPLRDRALFVAAMFVPFVLSVWPGWKARALAWLIYAVAYIWIGPGSRWRKKLAKKIASSLTEVQAAMFQREARANT